jgi:nicotinamidase-related amidase
MTPVNASTTLPRHLSDAALARLVVIDVQERLCAAMPAKVLNRVVQNASLLTTAALRIGVPVIVSEQYPAGLGGTVTELRELLTPACAVITKTRFSLAGLDAFEAALGADPGRSELVLLGMEAHVCVLQTAFDLADRGHTVRIVEDAICSRRLEDYQNALERLRAAGLSVVTSESLVFEWLRDAAHPAFRELQGLLRR